MSRNCYIEQILLYWANRVILSGYCDSEKILLYWADIVILSRYCYTEQILLYWVDTVILSLYCYSEQILLWWADTFIVSRYNSIVLVYYRILQYINIHYTTWKNYNSLSWIPALSCTRSVNLNNDGNIPNHWLKWQVGYEIFDGWNSSRTASGII